MRELSLELRSLGHDVTVITGAPGIFTDQLRQAGIPWLQVRSLVRPLRPHLDLAAFVQLWRALRQLKPDLVCAHTAKAGSLATCGCTAASHSQCIYPPWLVDVRSHLAASRIRSSAGQNVWPAGWAHASSMCASLSASSPSNSGLPGKALEVVHNGIAEIALARVRPIDAQPPVIVMVARFASQKDHGTLLQALSGLLCMEWRLLLVGTGELEPRVRRASGRAWPGRPGPHTAAGNQCGPFAHGSAIFVLSTHFEALPISILEAMRAGLPVVATNVGGISESVRHEETGLLARRGDVAGLRDALARVIARPRIASCSGRARDGAYGRTQFTASTMAARTVEALPSVVPAEPSAIRSN